MLFNNYLIFIYIVIFIATYNIAKWITKNLIFRNFIIFAGNLFILLTLVKEHTLIVLAVLSLLVFLMGKILQKKHLKSVLTASLLFIIVLFVIRNYPYIQEKMADGMLSFLLAPVLSVQKLGLSYILFRYIDYLVQSYKGRIDRPHFFTFLNYIFFFPSILAGPIDSYNNFSYWVANDRKSYQMALFFSGISRIFIGAIKTLAIVPLIIQQATDYHYFLDNHSPIIAIVLSLTAYSAYIYLDFSGYSDIAIGTAYLIGIKTPENFNNPYISKSLSEFWKRWHMTFSYFLSIYIFKPSVQLLNRLFKPKRKLPVTISAYLITFSICGIWHGDSINFVYWGAWHGIGLSINKVWTSQILTNSAIKESKLYQGISMLLTFTYVTVGWGFFHYTEDELTTLFNLII